MVRRMAKRWTSIGPQPEHNGGVAEGGRVTSMAWAWDVTPSSTPHTLAPALYLGTLGGVFRSDGLRLNDPAQLSWIPTSDVFPWLTPAEKIGIANVWSLVVDDKTPSRVFASTDAGLIRSLDSGQSWTLLSRDGRSASKLILDPADPSRHTLWAAAGDRGLLKSSDSGSTWTSASGLPSDFNANDIEYVLYGHLGRKVSLFVAGQVGTDNNTATGAIFESDDGGRSWKSMPIQAVDLATGNPAPLTALGTFNLAADHYPTPNGQDYRDSLLAISAKRFSTLTLNLFVVENGQWVPPANTNLPRNFATQGGTNQPVCSALIVDGWMFVGSATSGVWLTDDRGASWVQIGVRGALPHVDGWSLLWINGELYYGGDGGIFKWTPKSGPLGSGFWQSLNTRGFSAHLVNGFDFHPTNESVVIESSLDNGSALLGNWWTYIDGDDGNRSRFDPVDGKYAYQSGPPQQTTDGIHYMSRGDNQGLGKWQTTGHVPNSENVPFNPIWAIHPTQTNRLVMGFSRVYESTAYGDSPQPISPVLSSDPASAITYLGDNDSICAAFIDKIFLRSADGSWARIDGKRFKAVIDIGALTQRDNFSLYVVDQRGAVRRTDDLGGSWVDLTGNLPNIEMQSIAVQPRVDDGSIVLFLATADAVWAAVDRDANTRWSRFGDDLPDIYVSEVRLNPAFNLLGAGTRGRGLFVTSVLRLDDPSVVMRLETDPCGVGFVENSVSTFDAIASDFIRATAVNFAWTATGADIVGASDQSSVAVRAHAAGATATISVTASDSLGNIATAQMDLQPLPIWVAILVEIICQCFGPQRPNPTARTKCLVTL